jgi:hypothetical protein
VNRSWVSWLRLAGITLAPCLVMAALFAKAPPSSRWGFPRFVVAALLLGYLHGKLILVARDLELDGFEDLTCSMLLGLSCSGFVYAACGSFACLPLFLFWPLVILITAAVFARRFERQLLPHWIHHPANVLLVGIAGLAILPYAVLPLWVPNSVGASGEMIRPMNPDLILHLSFANELTHSVPPQIPFLAGRPLAYHYGMDVVAAMFSYAAGLNVTDLTVRYLPIVFGFLAVCAVFNFGRVWLGSPYVALSLTALMIFGEDLSFVPGLIFHPDAVWSATYFRVPSTFSLFYLNSMLPALGLLFGVLWAMSRFARRDGNSDWMLIASFLLAALSTVKIFTAVQVLAALALTALAHGMVFKETRWLKVLALASLFMLPALVHAWAGNSSGARYLVTLRLFPAVLQALDLARFSAHAPPEGMDAIYPSHLALLALVGLPVFLVGSLGLRVIGLPAVFRAIRMHERASALRFLLAAFALLGIGATLVLEINIASGRAYDNSAWFYVQSKYIAWIFAVECIWRRLGSAKAGWQTLGLIGAVTFSSPSTLQYLGRQARLQPGVSVSPADVHLFRFLEGTCSNGEVLLGPDDLAASVVALTKCRVPFADVFTNTVVPQDEIDRRTNDVSRFWAPGTPRAWRRHILQTYDVTYVLVRSDRDLRGPAPVGRRDVLIFENSEYALYSLWRPSGERPPNRSCRAAVKQRIPSRALLEARHADRDEPNVSGIASLPSPPPDG